MYRIGRMAAIGIPVWLVLLVLLPLSGLGALACLSIATALAGGVAVWGERWFVRRNPTLAQAPGPPGGRRPMSPLTAAGLTLGAVLLVVWIVFVVATVRNLH